MKKNQIMTILILTVGFTNCVPNIRTQTSKYNTLVEQIETTIKQYPRFGSYLKQDLKIAKQEWVFSLRLIEKEKKATTMANVNKRLQKPFIRQLVSINSRMIDLDERLREIPLKKFNPNDYLFVNDTILSIRKNQRLAIYTLKHADVSNNKVAFESVENSALRLTDAENQLKQIEEKVLN